MLVECEYDPDDLIDLIGDKNFSIEIEENLSTLERSMYDAVIVDCEREVTIRITSSYGKEDGLLVSEALLNLLNQEYTYMPNDFATL